MHFLDTLFNRSINTTRRTLNKRSLNKRTKTLALETLEQRIALDASGVRSQLEPVREVHIDNTLVGPDPIVFGKSELIGHNTRSFVITAVAAGSTVEKLDVSTNQWRNVSAPVTTSNPSELIRLMRLRVIQEGDQVRWLAKSTDGVTQKAFEIIGWDDGSETTEPEGVNLPGAVENLAVAPTDGGIEVSWEAPLSGSTATHYTVRATRSYGDSVQSTTNIVPVSESSDLHKILLNALPLAVAAYPADVEVTVHANSDAGLGTAATATHSTGTYINSDGDTVVINDVRTQQPLNYTGPDLKPGVSVKSQDLSYADLDGAQLMHADLSGSLFNFANLSGAAFVGTTITNTDLSLANLYEVNSKGIKGTTPKLPTGWQVMPDGQGVQFLVGSGADLSGGNWANADLKNADLSYALMFSRDTYKTNLAGADLTGAYLNGTMFMPLSGGPPAHLPTDWDVVQNSNNDSYLIGPGAQYDYPGLQGADLSGRNLKNVSLTVANFTGTNLNGTDLSDAMLWGAYGIFHGTPAHLPPDWSVVTNSHNQSFLVGPGAFLTNVNLDGVDLSSVNLTGIQSDGTITGTPTGLPTDFVLLKGCLIGPTADLTRVVDLTLTGADLSNLNLRYTSVYKLNHANLEGTHFEGADLGEGFFTGATGKAFYDSSTTFPVPTPDNPTPLTPSNSGWTDQTPTELHRTGSYQNTNGGFTNPIQTNTGTAASYAGVAVMSGSSLGGTGMNAGTFDLTNTNLSNVNLSGSVVDGFIFQRTNLANANLAGTVFMSVNLRNAILDGANVSGTTLGNGNDLYGLRAHNVTGTPASLPPSWRVVSNSTSAQFLIGPGVQLAGADLTGADLTGADLTDADLLEVVLTGATLHGATLTNAHLDSADLTGANITRVVSGGITVTGTPPTLPTNWQLIDGYLIGPGASLTNADLSHQNLTGANMQYVTGPDIHLDHATLLNTDLRHANLTGATLTGVTGAAKYNSATTLPAGFDPVAAGWVLIG